MFVLYSSSYSSFHSHLFLLLLPWLNHSTLHTVLIIATTTITASSITCSTTRRTRGRMIIRLATSYTAPTTIAVGAPSMCFSITSTTKPRSLSRIFLIMLLLKTPMHCQMLSKQSRTSRPEKMKLQKIKARRNN